MPDDKKTNMSSHSKSDDIKFFIKVFAFMIVSIVLGIYFIKNLFDDKKTLKQFDVSHTLGKYASLSEPLLAPNQINIFFTADGRTLTPETREQPPNLPTTEKIRFILNELIKGPKQGYFEETIPKDTKIRGIYLLGDKAVVDFSVNIIDDLWGGFSSELIAVYSIVNSIILNCKDISSVKILIDGNSKEVFNSYIDIETPLSENIALNQW